VDLASVP